LSFTITYFINFGQVHWLINSDSIPKCELIKSGKFVNKETIILFLDCYFKTSKPLCFFYLIFCNTNE